MAHQNKKSDFLPFVFTLVFVVFDLIVNVLATYITAEPPTARRIAIVSLTVFIISSIGYMGSEYIAKNKDTSKKLSLSLLPSLLKRWLVLGLGTAVAVIIVLILVFWPTSTLSTTLKSQIPLGDKAQADSLYKQIVVGSTPNLKDQFTDAGYSRLENGWTLYAQSKVSCQISGNYLVSLSEANGAVADCYATVHTWTNFAYQIHIASLDGDWGGMVFRAAGPNSSGPLYRFGISPKNQTFQILVQSASSRMNPVCNQAQQNVCLNTAIHQDGDNTLTIIAQASDFYFFVNSIFVGQLHDTTNTLGIVGVFSYAYNGPCTTRVNSAEVWSFS